MRAGKLRHRITLQGPGEVQDPDSGEMLAGWTDIATVYGSVEPLSSREFIAAQAGQSQIVARVTIRYRSGLTSDMRIVHRGTVYNVAGALPDAKSGREYLTIPVTAGVNDG